MIGNYLASLLVAKSKQFRVSDYAATRNIELTRVIPEIIIEIGVFAVVAAQRGRASCN